MEISRVKHLILFSMRGFPFTYFTPAPEPNFLLYRSSLLHYYFPQNTMKIKYEKYSTNKYITYSFEENCYININR